MKVRINGEEVRDITSIEVHKHEFSHAAGWFVIILGIVGWWLLWA